jgi:hypothetical protein
MEAERGEEFGTEFWVCPSKEHCRLRKNDSKGRTFVWDGLPQFPEPKEET